MENIANGFVARKRRSRTPFFRHAIRIRTATLMKPSGYRNRRCWATKKTCTKSPVLGGKSSNSRKSFRDPRRTEGIAGQAKYLLRFEWNGGGRRASRLVAARSAPPL